MTSWHIKTHVYEGPLEALVDLIEKRKLLVNDVSLTQVADDFVAYVQTLESLPHDVTADFLLVASTLLLIKSKSLLPELPVTHEEQASMEDLARRLKAYQHTRIASQKLRTLFGERMMFSSLGSGERPHVFVPSKETDKGVLKEVLRSLISTFPPLQKREQVSVQPTITLEEVMKDIGARVLKTARMSFRSLLKDGRGDKATLIISFLATLQLAREGVVSLEQPHAFGDIDIESRTIGTPRYNS